jgi:hypothetical protein
MCRGRGEAECSRRAIDTIPLFILFAFCFLTLCIPEIKSFCQPPGGTVAFCGGMMLLSIEAAIVPVRQ